MLYICEQRSIIKMDTDVLLLSLLLFSFKLMAQFISHTLPLLKTTKPKENSTRYNNPFWRSRSHCDHAFEKKTAFRSGTPLLFQSLQFRPSFKK